MMMTAESILSKRPVLKIVVVFFLLKFMNYGETSGLLRNNEVFSSRLETLINICKFLSM